VFENDNSRGRLLTATFVVLVLSVVFHVVAGLTKDVGWRVAEFVAIAATLVGLTLLKRR
jgi:uncharacterized membrane protein